MNWENTMIESGNTMDGDENNANGGVNVVKESERTMNRSRKGSERRIMYCKLNMEVDEWMR